MQSTHRGWAGGETCNERICTRQKLYKKQKAHSSAPLPSGTGTPTQDPPPSSPHPLQLCFPRSSSLKSRSDVLPPQPLLTPRPGPGRLLLTPIPIQTCRPSPGSSANLTAASVSHAAQDTEASGPKGPEPPAALAQTDTRGVSSAPEEHPTDTCQSVCGAHEPRTRERASRLGHWGLNGTGLTSGHPLPPGPVTALPQRRANVPLDDRRARLHHTLPSPGSEQAHVCLPVDPA